MIKQILILSFLIVSQAFADQTAELNVAVTQCSDNISFGAASGKTLVVKSCSEVSVLAQSRKKIIFRLDNPRYEVQGSVSFPQANNQTVTIEKAVIRFLPTADVAQNLCDNLSNEVSKMQQDKRVGIKASLIDFTAYKITDTTAQSDEPLLISSDLKLSQIGSTDGYLYTVNCALQAYRK